MCGISVIIAKNNNSVDISELYRMNNSITHRGPDSEGYYCDENICLGHRRLSIIDLSEKGRQPMEYIDRYAITYNGEIYNYIELRKELEGFGFIFKTDTDTEVILIAYHKWGKDCLSRFNGMWSFCLYDKKEKIALLARDRFGIKPLYIKETDKAIYFGSEIKQLLTITPIHKVNEKVLMNYLIFGMNDISNETFFDSINILPASYYLLVDTKTGNSEIIQYYSLKINPIIREMNDNEAIVEYHNLLRDSISLRLRSDVKVGTCLSGGLDSSYVASISSDIYTLNSDAKFTGITAGSIDSTNDEKNWAEKIAINKNLDWQVTSPSKEEFLKNIEKVIEIQEEPFTTPSVFMQFFVAKKASESGCVVLLDGQGGDETLLGYERYYASFLSSIPFFLRFSSFNEIAKNSRLNLIQTILMSFYFTNHTIRKSILMWRSRYIKQQYLKLADWTFIEDMTKASKNLDSLQKFEITKSCLPHLLKYEDRNSMHFSIEARLPFIDYRVVEYAISLKHKLKIHEGWSKYVLRKGSKNILPDEIRWRKKKFGFEAPDKIWLSDSAYFKKEIDNSVILKSVFNKIPPIDNKEVLWRLYNIAKWEQIFNVTL